MKKKKKKEFYTVNGVGGGRNSLKPNSGKFVMENRSLYGCLEPILRKLLVHSGRSADFLFSSININWIECLIEFLWSSSICMAFWSGHHSMKVLTMYTSLKAISIRLSILLASQ